MGITFDGAHFLTDFSRLSQLTDELDLLLSVTNQTHFLMVSDNWTQKMGWTREELLSKSYIDFIVREDVGRSSEAWDRVASGLPVTHFRNKYRHKNGSIRVLEWFGKIYDGKSLAIAQDITSRIHEEDRWKLAHQVVKETGDAILTLDRAGTVLVWNQAAEQLFEWKESEVIGTSLIKNFLTDSDQSNFIALLSDIVKEPKTHHSQMLWRKKTGGFIEVAVTVSPLFGIDKNVQLMSVIAQNITEQVRLANLHDQTEQTANVGGWEVNLQTQKVRWTDQTYRIYEVPLGECMDLDKVIGFYEEWSKPIIRQAIAQAIFNAQPFDMELQICTRKGKKIWVRSQGRTLLVEGKTYRLFGTVQDISDRKREEAALQRAHSHLVSTEKFASLGALSAAIAHEINNPLAILQSKVDIMKRLLETERFDKQKFLNILGRLDSNVKRMSRISSELRGYSQKEDKLNKFTFLNLDSLIQSIVDMNNLRIDELSVKVETFFPAVLEPLEGNETSLYQVFSNLLVNALDVVETLEERWIRITIEQALDYTQICFMDSGKGIPEVVQVRLFEPFFSTKGARGTGLGLSLSRRFVENHGGQISLDTKASHTCFIIKLPNRQKYQVNKSKLFVSDFSVKSAHILLIEDEVELADSLKFFLEEEGFKVIVCNTAASAMEHMTMTDFAVILCDYRLPDGSGEDLLRRVPERARSSRWIFMTGYSDVLTSPNLGSSIVAVMRKPIDYGEVIRRVRLAHEAK
ncbi:MAG: PAS domain S-box protein [Bdellovibrionales bacterium]|nr:PAS domain S-box protein [Bdellovibrionales bacterium]